MSKVPNLHIIFITFFKYFCFLENVVPLDKSLTQDYEISDYCSDDPCDKNASCMETVGALHAHVIKDLLATASNVKLIPLKMIFEEQFF